MESMEHLGRGHHGGCDHATHEPRQPRWAPPPEHLKQHQQLCRVARESESHQLSFLRRQMQNLLLEVKTKDEILEKLHHQVCESRRACEEFDFFVKSTKAQFLRSSHSLDSTKWRENAQDYEGAPQSQSPSVTPEASTLWTPEASNEDTLPLTLAPIENPNDASSSPPASSGSDQDKAGGSLFSGTTLVVIVLLTALPAAILIGVFFLRRRRA